MVVITHWSFQQQDTGLSRADRFAAASGSTNKITTRVHLWKEILAEAETETKKYLDPERFA